jgi:gas vesicle protein
MLNFKYKVMSVKHVISGLCAGMAAGMAIGILLAPDSGEKTRLKLQNGSRRLLDELRSNVDDLKDKYNRGVDDLASRSKAGISSAREKIKV